MSSSVETGTEVPVIEGEESLFHPTYEAYNLKYEDEWLQLVKWSESGREKLACLAVTGQLEKSRFRSVIWQILLGILPHQPCLWIQKLRQQRNQYRSKRDLLLINPHLALEDDHPLSEDSSSAWHRYFCDKELRATIRKDVVRTSPGDNFFDSESVQSTMINILFLYAREHPEICYRQGVHEVLAPLLLVLHADQRALIEAQKVMSVPAPIPEVLDHSCLEEDAYWLLDSIMEYLGCMYSIPDVPSSSIGAMPKRVGSEVCSRMQRIRDEILDVWDRDLRQHLLELDIPLYFGIRWLRPMFGQEFDKENLLILWDAIFGADENFGLVNYIVVAMLKSIRNRLLEEDYIGCLDLLVHYPPDNQIHSIVSDALHMLKPTVYSRPDDNFDPAKSVAGTGSSTISGRIRRLVSRSRKSDSELSSTTTASRSLSSRFRGSRHEQGDTYAQNILQHSVRDLNQDPTELLTSLQNKLNLTSLRLAEYQATLEHHLTSSGAPISVLIAVKGIKEISEMLAEMGLPQIEVETAVEATQSQNVSAPSPLVPIIASPSLSPTAPDKIPNPSLTKSNKKKDGEMDLMSVCEEPVWKSNFVLSNPLRNQGGSGKFRPVRDTNLHCTYRRVLGEGKIFARIKQ